MQPQQVTAQSSSATQLSLLTDADLNLVTASSDSTGDKRPKWYSKLLTCGLLRTLYHRHHGVATFVSWNLARMGGYRWHDLSEEQIARELGIHPRSARRLMAKAVESGDLQRAREPGHGRRKVTRPGIWVDLHPTFYDDHDDANPDRHGPPTRTATVPQPGPPRSPTDKSSDKRSGRRSGSTRQAEPPCVAAGMSMGEHLAGYCSCERKE